MNVSSREIQTLFSVGTLGGLSDGRLLERFAAHRDELAFEALVRRHGSMVWAICRRLLRDHHDAEDAFQATFLVLARKGQSIAQQELVANWLYAVAYQTALKARSTRARRRMREGQVTDMPEPEAVPLYLRDDLTESLDRELNRLPDKYRIPIVLCELEEKTHQEAAELLSSLKSLELPNQNQTVSSVVSPSSSSRYSRSSSIPNFFATSGSVVTRVA